MDDATALITAVAGLVVAMGIAMPALGAFILSLRSARLAEAIKDKVVVVDAKIAAVRSATEEKLGEIHTLVNGQRGSILRSGALSARALHKAEPTAENLALMNKADEDLAKHDEAEAMIRADQDGGRVYGRTRYTVK